MIETYILSSDHFTGAIQVSYKSGLLVFYDAISAELSEAQLVSLLKKMPREEQDLQIIRDTKYFIIKKLSEDLSFEAFWERYGKKIHTHRCEPLWRKCSDAKKVLHLRGIEPYKAYIKRTGVAMVNPENYLRKEYYKTDWSKE